jgi:hypothetical protein
MEPVFTRRLDRDDRLDRQAVVGSVAVAVA